jgi:hypothetical protein
MWLLAFPQRSILWLPHILFYTLILFIVWVFAVRMYDGHWGPNDYKAVLIAAAIAAVIRSVVYWVSRF